MSVQLIHDGLVQGAVTITAFASFIGICVYAYAPSQKKRFERAAQEPLNEEEDITS